MKRPAFQSSSCDVFSEIHLGKRNVKLIYSSFPGCHCLVPISCVQCLYAVHGEERPLSNTRVSNENAMSVMTIISHTNQSVRDSIHCGNNVLLSVATAVLSKACVNTIDNNCGI
jgi:hypothetical protein